MQYDFDKVIDRKNTCCVKYDAAKKMGMPEDILPLWVADMDFQSPQGVIDRLQQAVSHGIFGYSEEPDSYYEAVAAWYQKRFGWKTKKEWLVTTPGVVFAVSAAVRAFTEPGDGVLIQQPVYYPFKSVIENNSRIVVNNALRFEDGKYRMDFDDLEKKAAREDVKLMILCSPHNPVGRVWEEWELRRAGDICLKYGVKVISDEIHGDFVYPGHRHFVFADLSEKYADISMICTAPSKTFNLAGLQASNIFIPNESMRNRYREVLQIQACGELNYLGMLACQAAYETGEDWLEALLVYLQGNLNYIREFLGTRIPQVKLVEPEGTYLVWLDFNSLGLDEGELEELIVKKARLWLDGGTMFGEAGKGFQRVNIACPRTVIMQALERLETEISRRYCSCQDFAFTAKPVRK